MSYGDVEGQAPFKRTDKFARSTPPFRRNVERCLNIKGRILIAVRHYRSGYGELSLQAFLTARSMRCGDEDASRNHSLMLSIDMFENVDVVSLSQLKSLQTEPSHDLLA